MSHSPSAIFMQGLWWPQHFPLLLQSTVLHYQGLCVFDFNLPSYTHLCVSKARMFSGVSHLRLNFLLVHSVTQCVRVLQRNRTNRIFTFFIRIGSCCLWNISKKFHNLPSPSWGTQKACGVIQPQSDGPRVRVWVGELGGVSPALSLIVKNIFY